MALIKLDKEAYKFNLRQLALRAGGHENLICVFKDNAYGHGAQILAPIAREEGVGFIATRNEQEALALEAHFKDILILSHRPNGKEDPRFIYALNEPLNLKDFKKNTRIHLKIDTGMRRNGICLSNLKEFLDSFHRYDLKLEGIFTHFAAADEDESYHFQRQNFQKAKDLARNFNENLIFHSFNSVALSRDTPPKDELCRVGLLQFGYGDDGLKKVLSLHANRLSQRTLQKGQSMGYDNAFVAQEKMRVGTYDLGYADGLFRYDARGGLRLADGREILGKMSMDSFSCEDGGEELCVFDDARIWAEFFHTISYEILVKLHPSIPRILI